MFLGPSGQGSGCLMMMAEVGGLNDKYWPRLWNLDRFRRLFLTRLGRRGFLQVVESCLAELEKDFVLPPLVIRILLVKCLWHVLDVNELLKWKKERTYSGGPKAFAEINPKQWLPKTNQILGPKGSPKSRAVTTDTDTTCEKLWRCGNFSNNNLHLNF